MAGRIAICTGGGDAPGLNAVIRAFVQHGTRHLGLEIVGIEDAFNGLLDAPRRLMPLDVRSCRGLLHRGGTILGTTNRGDPFAFPSPDGPRDRSAELRAAVEAEGIAGIVSVGGDGTQAIALRLMEQCGIPMIGVPKTIDNDLGATDLTFGFESAVACATDALDRLHTTAESHDRVMLLEVMGRDTGHIALHAGIAGGADVILIPEIPYDPAKIADKIHQRKLVGRSFTLVVVAEGAVPNTVGALDRSARKSLCAKMGGAAAIAMAELARLVDAEMRTMVLGHLQRGGSPVAVDRLLATRYGVGAAELVAAGRWGEMVRIRNDHVEGVPIREAVASVRYVDPDGELVRVARATGITFG
ncbi:MAG: ATP-dependent 6-phosphofructokinase [Myxococcota bacterium]